MGATLLKLAEGVPDYSGQANVPDADIMKRFEAFIHFRWGVRTVKYIAEGPGEFIPLLTPTTITSIKSWSSGIGAWEMAELEPSALGGYWLPYTGPFRFTGKAGSTEAIPADVCTALARYKAYIGSYDGGMPKSIAVPPPGSTEISPSLEEELHIGALHVTFRRPIDWLSNALVLSGDADLLRKYRRFGAS